MEWVICLIVILSLHTKAEIHHVRDKFNGGKCRPEDFQSWSVEKGRCRWTKNTYAEEAEVSRVVCGDDELICRQIYKCVPRYYLNSEYDCLFNNPVKTILPCRDNEFTCEKTRRCLPRWSVFDKERDCDDLDTKDDSDETQGPYRKCLKSEFRCVQSGRCIPREWVMDGLDDCPGNDSMTQDTSDENGPLEKCHEDAEFRCSDNGRCFPRYRVKDGYEDCGDGTDERKPFSECKVNEFRCNDTGRCIPRHWVSNRIRNCKDGSDEVKTVSYSCKGEEFLCHNRRRCIPEMYLCDGMDHCGDCSDEIEGCAEPRMWRCPNNRSLCFPQSYACDVFVDCPNRKDTMSFQPGFKCDSVKTDAVQVTCAVPQWMLNDSHSVCLDESDLCQVDENSSCSHCGDHKTVISNAQVCDGVVDCTDLWDECLCSKNQQTSRVENLCRSVCYTDGDLACQKCNRGEIFCQEEDECVNRSRLCDGTTDCVTSRLDEIFCTKPNMENTDDIPQKNYTCQKLPDSIIFFLKLVKVWDLLKEFIPEFATKCDGILECLLFEDECSSECPQSLDACSRIPLHHIDLSTHTGEKNLVQLRTCPNFAPDIKFDYLNYISGASICNGVQECDDGADEENCTGRFYCNAGKVQWPSGTRNVTSIDRKKMCDMTSDCADESDEENCSKETHFYCYGGKPFFVSSDDVMDGRQDCDDNSDECPDFAYDKNAFSSREEMIRATALRYMIWIMATLAMFGNVGVFLETFFAESSASAIAKSNRVLVANLAISDFLMGVALLMIGIKSATLSGDYCQRDNLWRTSNLCSFIGAVVVLSSETSVFTLAILTYFRLYGVCRPFKSRHFKVKVVVAALAMVWLASLIFAILPVLPVANQSMITHALTRPSRYFQTTKITWQEMHEFAVRSVVLGNMDAVSPEDLSTWQGIARLQEHSEVKNDAPKIIGYFGYYSADGVCIPRLFRSKESQNLHPFAVSIIIVNFCILVSIIISYCVIYKVTTKTAENVKSDNRREKTNKAMQRKITLLVGTDLCCWLPICIMTFLSLADVTIPKDAYAVCAIVLLPINSSLNPVIYSNGFELARKYLSRKVRQISQSKKTETRDETP